MQTARALPSAVADRDQGRSEPSEMPALGVVAIARPEGAGRVDRGSPGSRRGNGRTGRGGRRYPACRTGRRRRELRPGDPELVAHSIEQARDVRVITRTNGHGHRRRNDLAGIVRLDPDRARGRMERDLDRRVGCALARDVRVQGAGRRARQPLVDAPEQGGRIRHAPRGAATAGLSDGLDRDRQLRFSPMHLRRDPTIPARTDWRKGRSAADRPARPTVPVRGGRYPPPVNRARDPREDAGRGDSWPRPARETLIDRQIREAQAAGAFDDLPFRGERIPLEDDSAAGDWALAHHILKNADMVPPWIATDREVRDLLARRDAILARAPRSSSIGRTRDRAELQVVVEAANRAIAILNNEAPTDRQHRRPLDLEREFASLAKAHRDG